MHLRYFLFLLWPMSSNTCGSKFKEGRPLSLIVLKKYNITCGTDVFFQNPHNGYKEIQCFLSYNRHQMEMKMCIFFNQYFSYIVHTLNKQYIISLNKELVYNMQKIIASIYINKDFTQVLDSVNNRMVIQYYIIPIDTKEVEVLEEILAKTAKIDMQLVAQYYSFIPWGIREKSLMETCEHCNKNELRNILISMKNGEKKIIFLHTVGRYVLINRKGLKPVEPIDPQVFKRLYMKYGLSLMVSAAEIEKQLYKIFHHFYCQ